MMGVSMSEMHEERHQTVQSLSKLLPLLLRNTSATFFEYFVEDSGTVD